jgi:hypothetical protein
MLGRGERRREGEDNRGDRRQDMRGGRIRDGRGEERESYKSLECGR